MIFRLLILLLTLATSLTAAQQRVMATNFQNHIILQDQDDILITKSDKEFCIGCESCREAWVEQKSNRVLKRLTANITKVGFLGGFFEDWLFPQAQILLRVGSLRK